MIVKCTMHNTIFTQIYALAEMAYLSEKGITVNLLHTSLKKAGDTLGVEATRKKGGGGREGEEARGWKGGEEARGRKEGRKQGGRNKGEEGGGGSEGEEGKRRGGEREKEGGRG